MVINHKIKSNSGYLLENGFFYNRYLMCFVGNGFTNSIHNKYGLFQKYKKTDII